MTKAPHIKHWSKVLSLAPIIAILMLTPGTGGRTAHLPETNSIATMTQTVTGPEEELRPEQRVRTPAPVYVTHEVKSGDSVWAIAQAHGLSEASVGASNNLGENAILQPGQELLVPTQEGLLYKVLYGDTADGLANRFGLTVEAITAANPELDPEKLAIGQRLLLPGSQAPEKFYLDRVRVASAGSGASRSSGSIASRGSSRPSAGAFDFWPVRGQVTSGFGWRRHPVYGTRSFHEGLDISAPSGTSIKAVREGKVIFSGPLGDYGLTVKIQHRDGMVTRYSHNSENLVSVGDTVQAGDVIGLVGRTGVATGPHVDFGVIVGGSPVDPRPWLP